MVIGIFILKGPTVVLAIDYYHQTFRPPYSGLHWQMIQKYRQEAEFYCRCGVHVHSNVIEGGGCVGMNQLVVLMEAC